jgi:hypothetical protein
MPLSHGMIYNDLLNKLESIKRKFADLYSYRLSQFDILRNKDLILDCLNFRTLYSRRRYLDALFLISAFKVKIQITIPSWTLMVGLTNKKSFYLQREQCAKTYSLQLGAPVL